LNREVDGVLRPDMLELLPGADQAVRRINESSFLAICVTNQPSVAKGFMSMKDLTHVHWQLDAALARGGAFLDDLFFCPHHPEAGFPGEIPALKIACECRKPNPGMLVAAARKHNIDLDRSFLIGDHLRDVQAAAAVGVQPYLLGSDPDSAYRGPYRFRDADNLGHAVDEILTGTAETQ
jgi:histidinol-phosphate phosphatase family protein